jgi:hypothetical protein
VRNFCKEDIAGERFKRIGRLAESQWEDSYVVEECLDRINNVSKVTAAQGKVTRAIVIVAENHTRVTSAMALG